MNPSETSESPSFVLAFRASVFTAVAFVGIFLSERSGILTFAPGSFSEAALRIAVVTLATMIAIRIERRKSPSLDFSNDALLSTILFYACTLAFTYAGEIAVLIFRMVSANGGMREGMMLLWHVPDFSTASIVRSALLSVLPYGTYYLVIRAAK